MVEVISENMIHSDWLMISLHFQDYHFVLLFEDLSELTLDKAIWVNSKKKLKHYVLMKG